MSLTADHPKLAKSLHASGTVLLVEDDHAVRSLVAELVEGLGFQVIEARDPLEAMEIAERPIEIDVLLTDVLLPGMNGRDLAEIVVENRPGLRVLFTSGDPSLAAMEDSFLAKPYQAEDLERALRDLFEEELPAA
ncbi:MAG TPA: response regulator [Gaiellaceae bacterium]|jgi:CheY-like chemotaxis protein